MLRYRVPDMTCGHCAQSIQRAIKGADPQAEVEVNLGSKEVTVRGQADTNRVEEAIRSAGYEPSAQAAP